MNKAGYALFAVLAAALGLWGFWLGRSSAKTTAPAAVEVAASTPQPLPAVEPPPAPAPEPEPAVTPAPAPVKKAGTPRPARPAVAATPRQTPATPAAPATPAPSAAPVPETKATVSPAPAPEEATVPKPVETAKVFKPEKDYESATPPKPREPHTATIPAGTLLSVRLRETVSAERNSSGDTFMASLDQPLVIDGFVIAERGASAKGHIVDLARAGRVKGRSVLALELKSLTTADGQRIDLDTDTFRREGDSGVKKDAARAGVMTAIGAAIGAMAGGGKGAAIGAGVGGAAGAGTVLATRGADANLPAETRLTFRLKNPVTITEKLN